MPAEEADARIGEALAQVGLADFADAYPRELSGGMKMRVSLARALVTDPDILLMDEPFAALDEITRFRLNNDLLALWRNLRKTVIFVTHSVFESVYLSQRVIVMTSRPGRIGAEFRIDTPEPRGEEFRTSADYAGYCREVSKALAPSYAGLARRMNRSDSPHARSASCFPSSCWRPALRYGSSSSGINDIRPMCCRGRSLVFQTLVGDWPVLSQSLGVTLLTTLEGFSPQPSAASRWRCCSINRNGWNIRCFPMP